MDMYNTGVGGVGAGVGGVGAGVGGVGAGVGGVGAGVGGVGAFWEVKKGSKSIQAWKQQITEYRKFIEKYGEKVLRDQLEQGILAGTWKGCTIKNYESIRKINNAFVEEEKVHPNQKVVQFDDMGNLI